MSESRQDSTPEEMSINSLGGSGVSRKSFLKYAGASAVAATTFGLIGCEDDEGPGPGDDAISLGEGDVAVLNYAYALEQLEAAFYIRAVDEGSLDSDVGNLMEDIRDHEIAHRDFLQAVINSIDSDATIPGLSVNFDAVDFNSQASILAVAQALEDTGVSAYNGAAHLISNSDAGEAYLLQAGKIVSVEARHAAAIRSAINPGSADFAADGLITVDSGLDLAASPADVLSQNAAGAFVETEIDASGLPEPTVDLRPITFG